MRIDVLSLFPNMFEGFLKESIIGKSIEQGFVNVNVTNFRDYANNKHNTVDDYPYGGGAGMVLKAEPIFSAVEDIRAETANRRVILMCPQGEPFSQKKALELSEEDHLVFICGHYEGYDERIRQYLVTDELSIGDYVLTGGELPAMVVIDAVVRLLPGVLGNEQSALGDSFQEGLLEHPHYTRPAVFRDWPVPDILLSGHHGNIEKWRRKESLRRTLQRRPELFTSIDLSSEDKKLLEEIKREQDDERKQR